MNIGQNVRRIRQEKGLTQWQLSQALNITPGAMLLIERGAIDCSIEIVRAIAEVLGVNEAKLIGKQ